MKPNKASVLNVVVAMTSALLCTSVALAQTAGAPVYSVDGSDVESRLTLLENQVKNRAEMQHRLQQQIDTIQLELDELRGAVEVHTNQLQKVLDRQRELYLEIDKRVEALKDTALVPDSQSAVNAQSATASVTQEVAGLSESDAYENAVNLILKSREYDLAIPEFQAFIARFPDSSYAPNAHYWLGQLLFNKQQWQDAAAQFEEVANKFTDSAKRPDALLKLGVIAEKTGDVAKAKQLFQQVVADYPNSSARKLAEARLK